jgi:hypothetical protein
MSKSLIMASMGCRGDVFDNAAESVVATIKAELVYRSRFKTKDEARLAVFRYIEGFYNPLRRHSSPGYMSPVEYERILHFLFLLCLLFLSFFLFLKFLYCFFDTFKSVFGFFGKSFGVFVIPGR